MRVAQHEHQLLSVVRRCQLRRPHHTELTLPPLLKLIIRGRLWRHAPSKGNAMDPGKFFCRVRSVIADTLCYTLGLSQTDVAGVGLCFVSPLAIPHPLPFFYVGCVKSGSFTRRRVPTCTCCITPTLPLLARACLARTQRALASLVVVGAVRPTARAIPGRWLRRL